MNPKAVGLRVLVALFSVLMLVALLIPEAWRAAPAGAETFRSIGEALFGQYLLAFELLSVLLVAALIGAVYLAWRGSS